MSLSALSSKLVQIRELLNTTIANKIEAKLKMSQQKQAGHLLVAQYLEVNIKELSRISADIHFVAEQIQNESNSNNDWRKSLGRMIELLTATIDNKSGLLQEIDRISAKKPVADLVRDNIQELSRIQADLQESFVLSNV